MGGLSALALAALTLAGSAEAETPSALWQGVSRVGVACLVNTDRGVERSVLHDRLCSRVRALVAKGAPLPVAAVEIGDPAMLRPDHLTLLVHASTGGTPDGRLMAVSIRPWRAAASADLLFAAEPRVVAAAATDADLEIALTVPLTQLLPWRTPGPRPIR